MARTQQDPARAEAVQGEVDGHVGGDLRMGISRIVPGDRVRVELSPLDPGKARSAARASKSIHQRGQP